MKRSRKDVKNTWKKCTKKDPSEPDYYDGVVNHPEPDIPEREVKWALGSITMNKASGCDWIPVELFKTLKDVTIEMLHSICQQIWKTQQWPQNWKRSVLRSPKKGSSKECVNHWTIALISHLVFLVPQMVNNPPAMWETWVQPMGCKGPLEEGMAAHSSILA